MVAFLDEARKKLFGQTSKRLPLGCVEGLERLPDAVKAGRKDCGAASFSGLSQMQCDSATVMGALTSFDHSVRHKPIHEADRAGMRQLQSAA